jgi:hypothetical protein
MLKNFNGDEIVLDHHQAWQVLEFFFGGDVGSVPGQLTDRDRSFAQALLVEAIDKSYAMSWVETLWKSSVKPNSAVKGIIKALGKKALRDWFKDTDAKSWLQKVRENDEFPELYQSVVSNLTRNWRSEWRIRLETGEFVAY